MDLYMKEREGKPSADCQSRSPMPSTSTRLSSSPWRQARPTGAGEADRSKRGRWGQARLVGAGETGGGRRGWWGQARPMGAVSRWAKSIVNKFLLISTPNSYSIRPGIQYRACSSYHLGVGLCRNRQGGRASAHDLASMGASAAGIGRSRR
jgi:hypothetical protein